MASGQYYMPPYLDYEFVSSQLYSLYFNDDLDIHYDAVARSETIDVRPCLYNRGWERTWGNGGFYF